MEVNERKPLGNMPLMEKHDLLVVQAVFKYIDKYGLEGAKAHFAFENAKHDFIAAYQRRAELCTNSIEYPFNDEFSPTKSM